MSHHVRQQIKHVIIKNSAYFETPYPVEMSSYTNTTLETINLNTNSIVHPKNVMNYLLKIIKYLSIFSNDVRLAIMRTLMLIIEDINNNEDPTEEH